MRHSPLIRHGRLEDAGRLAVVATQVWLHTYATDGISNEIAEYVLSEFTPQRYSQLLQDAACHVFVAELDKALVGLAVVKLGVRCPTAHGAIAELVTLYVQEHFAGRGVGKALLEAVEAKVQQEHSELWFTVNANNAKAIAFYTARGYCKAGTAYFLLGDTKHENHVFIRRDA